VARSAADFLPGRLSLRALRTAAERCRGCDLYKAATQTVFGEGKLHAKLMLIGEQPGDKEDRSGHPFVGPAGTLLRTALELAGIDPAQTYITNAVKHFKFIERGKQRIHASPKVTEIRACAPWLDAEIRVVQPQLVVALGATAGRSLFGSAWRLTEHRGHFVTAPFAARAFATIHPAAILRLRDADDRRDQMAQFVADLRTAADALAPIPER
jgi:uracil-DNA glycosylase family protein